jgi:hypothetical protein
VVAFTHFVTRPTGLTPQLWENLAKVLATGGTLVWDFLGVSFNLVVVAFSGAHGDIPPEDGMTTPAGEYTDARMSQMPE